MTVAGAMVREVPPRNQQYSFDWLSPVTVMLCTLGVYVAGRILIARWLAIPLLWGGSVAAESKAQWLTVTFVIATTIGVWFSPRRRMLSLESAERGGIGRHLGSVVALCYVVVGGVATVTLVHRLGGLGEVFRTQAAWASQIKERGLGPLYGLGYLFVIGWQILAFRALVRFRVLRSVIYALMAILPAVILGRRVIMVFAALPLLAFVH